MGGGGETSGSLEVFLLTESLMMSVQRVFLLKRLSLVFFFFFWPAGDGAEVVTTGSGWSGGRSFGCHDIVAIDHARHCRWSVSNDFHRSARPLGDLRHFFTRPAHQKKQR